MSETETRFFVVVFVVVVVGVITFYSNCIIIYMHCDTNTIQYITVYWNMMLILFCFQHRLIRYCKILQFEYNYAI